jgi:hypothetical protein
LKLKRDELLSNVAFNFNVRRYNKVWLQYTYQRPPQHGDAFYSTLRELGRKKRAMRNGVNRFWD